MATYVRKIALEYFWPYCDDFFTLHCTLYNPRWCGYWNSLKYKNYFFFLAPTNRKFKNAQALVFGGFHNRHQRPLLTTAAVLFEARGWLHYLKHWLVIHPLVYPFLATCTYLSAAPYTICSLVSVNAARPRQDLMTHAGFQQLYNQQSLQGIESPQDTIHRLVDEHKETLDKVTVVGHSLGGGKKRGDEVIT